VGAALWTGLTLKLDLFQHPKLARNTYRLEPEGKRAFKSLEDFVRNRTAPNLSVQVEWQQAKQQVWMRVEGALSASDAEGFGRRLREALGRSKSKLVLDLNKLRWDDRLDLRPLRENLAVYRSRIRLVLPKLSATHPELLLLAGMFNLYNG
jgi:hypothetical protein